MITTSYGTLQQSITSCRLPATGFELIQSHQAGVKTLNNKHAEKGQICHWMQKKMQYKTIWHSNTYIIGVSFKDTHT